MALHRLNYRLKAGKVTETDAGREVRVCCARLPPEPHFLHHTMKIRMLLCLLGSVLLSHADAGPEKETKYLAFQIFTRFTPDPKDAQALSSGMREPLVPGTAALRNYVEDIKRRIGTVGNQRAYLLANHIGSAGFLVER